MSLILRIPGVTFTDATLPKLYRDSVITPGTHFLYDALNPFSYAKQANPAAGAPSADKLVNLVDAAADGLLYDLSTSWAVGGGFNSLGGPSDKIAAKNNVTPAVLTKCVGVVWLKPISTGGSATDMVAQFGELVAIMHSNANNNYYAVSNASANRQVTALDTSENLGSVLQLAVAFDNVDLQLRFFINGVQVMAAGGYRVLQAPTKPHSLMVSAGYGSGYLATFYRWLFDDLSSGATADEIVAADYAANVGRFS